MSQKRKLDIVTNYYKARDHVIQFYIDYTNVASKAKYIATQARGIKILLPKQILQRIPILFAQVQARNTSEILLNEIRQIVYSLYQAK